MGKRGPKPGTRLRRHIDTSWTPKLAYAIGLIASDGCLSPPGHLLNLTSNDREQLENFARCLNSSFKIGKKNSGSGGRCLQIQFKSAAFYSFLLSIGLTPAKSKTLGALKIPNKYFFDFLRGVFDGDGSTYSYWDPRWKSSFMFYVQFASASKIFIEWLQRTIVRHLSVSGRISRAAGKSTYQLKYAKGEGIVVLREMYRKDTIIFLRRKRLKIDQMLSIVGERL